MKRVYAFRDLKDVLVSDWKFTASMLDSDACLGIFGAFFGEVEKCVIRVFGFNVDTCEN